MRRWVCILLTVFMAVTLWGCNSEQEGLKRYEAEFLTLFDTATSIVGYARTKEEFEAQVDCFYNELKKYHQLYDIYNDYPGVVNIKTINENAGKQPVKVAAEIIDMLEFSKEIYELSEGKVNVAFGSVLLLWHNAREEGIDSPETAQIPDMAELSAAAIHTDIDKVKIDRTLSTVFLADEKMRLDVGAIAKGYAVEQAAKTTEKKYPGISMLISVGGNIRAIGYKDAAKETPWNVGVQNPDQNSEKSTLCSLLIHDFSLVTSGNYQRYYYVDGKRYHHIIDPETLMPAEHYQAVTVLCQDSGMADGLSTAAYILPIAEAKALLKKVAGAEGYFVMNDGTTQSTEGFKNHMK